MKTFSQFINEEACAPATYRKKPVDAMVLQYTGDNAEAIKNFTAGSQTEAFIKDKDLYIKTLEGDMEVKPGSYVVRGVKGEYWAVAEDIFKETYDGPITKE